jgi:ribonuclease HI
MAEILIEVDGSSRINPGPAGIGVVVVGADGTILKQISRAIGEATNNQAEYTALVSGLVEAASFPNDTVVIQTDSELLYPLWSRAHHLLRGLPDVRLRLVSREHNRRADKLARSASAAERKAADQQELDLH